MNHQKQTPTVFARFLPPAEQRLLLGTINQFSGDIAQRDGAACTLLIGSGMRVGEFLKISVGDAVAALETGYLFIPKERRKGEACDLSILCTITIRKALNDLLSLREGAEMDEALVISRNSKARGWQAMTVRAFEMRVKYWAEKAGIKATPHWFRHTHAKNIMRETTAADPLRIVQSALGHTSRKSSEVYTRLDRTELETALREVDGKVNGRPRLRMADLRRDFERRVGA